MQEMQHCYDPSEVVLMAATPFMGITLEERVTAPDIIAIAEAETQAMGYEPESKGRGIADSIMRQDLAQETKEYIADTFNAIARSASFSFQNMPYWLRFSVSYSLREGERWSLGMVEQAIRHGDYLWSLELYTCDAVLGNRNAIEFFYVDIDKTPPSAGGAQVHLEGSRVSLRTPLDTIQDVLIDISKVSSEHCDLIPRLAEFVDRYPVDSVIDPVTYTIEFLQLLRE